MLPATHIFSCVAHYVIYATYATSDDMYFNSLVLKLMTSTTSDDMYYRVPKISYFCSAYFFNDFHFYAKF